MKEDNDYPKLGRDIQSWSELDPSLPLLDLDIELFRRRNVRIASLVILSALLKENRQQRKELLGILSPQYFDPKTLPMYLFTKIVIFLQGNETIPVSELEKWIPEYSYQVWGESPPEERMLYSNQYTLRQILNFEPNEAQVDRAIELRKMVMEKKGY
jgi:hypothetical protein